MRIYIVSKIWLAKCTICHETFTTDIRERKLKNIYDIKVLSMCGQTITIRSTRNYFTLWRNCIWGKRMSLDCSTVKYCSAKLLRIFSRTRFSRLWTWDIRNTYNIICVRKFVSNIIRSLQLLIILNKRTVTKLMVLNMSKFCNFTISDLES